MWRFIYLVLIPTSSSEKFLEYRPGINYGQVLRDYSNNGRHAVKGSSIKIEKEDVISTDRGCYFDGAALQKITLPSNDVSASAFLLPSSFMIAFWSLADNLDGLILLRYMNNANYFYLRRFKDKESVALKVVINGVSVGEDGYEASSFVKSNFYLDIWNFICVVFRGNAIELYRNNKLYQTLNLQSNYVENGLFSMIIGGSFNGVKALSFYIWTLGC